MPYIIRDKNYQIHDQTPPSNGYNRVQHPHIRDERLIRCLFFIFGVLTDLLAVAVIAFTIYSQNSQTLKNFLDTNQDSSTGCCVSYFRVKA